MLPIIEAIIKKPKSVVRTAIEEIMPWNQYEEMVKDLEQYVKIDEQKKEIKPGNLLQANEDIEELNNYAVYQLKISLNGIRPAIWRTIQVEPNITLKRLAATILAVMGWENCHTHQFEINHGIYAIPSGEDDVFNDYIIDERKVILHDIDANRFKFEYDLGDSWKHTIVLEKNMQPRHDIKFPVCIKGARKCPPEDCGGPYFYNDYLRITSDSKHPEHKTMAKCLGENFNPLEFDIDSINRQLKDKIKKFEYGMEPMPNLLNR